jgi:hypothetical protein
MLDEVRHAFLTDRIVDVPDAVLHRDLDIRGARIANQDDA